MKRRTYVGALAGTVTTALAGCSAIIEGLLARALDDVNLISNSEEPVGIRFEIVDADGELVFEQTGHLDGVDEQSEDETSTMRFGDIWEAPGEYTVTAEVDERLTNTEPITIEDTDDSVLIAYEDGALEIGLFEELADD